VGPQKNILCLSHPVCEQHLQGIRHPEQPARISAIRHRLQNAGIWQQLVHREPDPIEDQWILLNHSMDYLAEVKRAAQNPPAVLDGGDTIMTEKSLEAARRAAGAAVMGIDAILQGKFYTVFALVRPPGHHAEYDHAMGFCIFNNIAIAAHYAIEHYGVKRVFILDWDVHHGNGTQHSFEWRADVFFCSIHQWPLFPGTGSANEQGKGDGKGYTRNFPLPAGSDDTVYLQLMKEEILPLIQQYHPELLLISAGFDAHAGDPLAGMQVSSRGFAEMTQMVGEVAHQVGVKGILSFLEGGYHLEHLAESVQVHLEKLAECSPSQK